MEKGKPNRNQEIIGGSEAMTKIIITIEITDPETLEAYSDVHPDLILDDFMACPTTWLGGSDIDCSVEVIP